MVRRRDRAAAPGARGDRRTHPRRMERAPRAPGAVRARTPRTARAPVSVTLDELARRTVVVVGNIGPDLGGESPLLALERAGERAVFVDELSSFQLEGLEISPDIAVLLDVVPEHLDHHGGFEAYLDAKENVTRHQQARDWLVYDAASASAAAVAARTRAQLMPYRADGPVERGCFVEEGHRIVFAAAFGREDVIDVSEVARV